LDTPHKNFSGKTITFHPIQRYDKSLLNTRL
jgi:hypothetical protein